LIFIVSQSGKTCLPRFLVKQMPLLIETLGEHADDDLLDLEFGRLAHFQFSRNDEGHVVSVIAFVSEALSSLNLSETENSAAASPGRPQQKDITGRRSAYSE